MFPSAQVTRWSIDTLKQDAEYRVYLEQATWDVIVIDEAHNVADRGTGSQRNGRVDRYVQKAMPRIVYLVTESANPVIRGDTRILEVLMEKDEQAYRNIGDPSVFMDVHDIDEEEIARRAVAQGESDVDFDRRLTPELSEGESLLAMFLQSGSDEATTPPTSAPAPPRSSQGWDRTRPWTCSARSTLNTLTRSPGASSTRSGCWTSTGCSSSSRA